jgi:hypothetical protein
MACPNSEKNLKACNCSYPGCPRKGLCCDCLTYHRAKGQLPACYFSKDAEATWDRSVDAFLKDRASRA